MDNRLDERLECFGALEALKEGVGLGQKKHAALGEGVGLDEVIRETLTSFTSGVPDLGKPQDQVFLFGNHQTFRSQSFKGRLKLKQ